jgi:phage gp45-like
MADIPLKMIGQQISVTTANTVYNSSLVRVYAPNVTLVTTTDANNTVIGSMTMAAGGVETLVKNYTDTITANLALLCTPLAWR